MSLEFILLSPDRIFHYQIVRINLTSVVKDQFWERFLSRTFHYLFVSCESKRHLNEAFYLYCLSVPDCESWMWRLLSILSLDCLSLCVFCVKNTFCNLRCDFKSYLKVYFLLASTLRRSNSLLLLPSFFPCRRLKRIILTYFSFLVAFKSIPWIFNVFVSFL